MKRKKLISVGIALFALLVVSLSSWFLVKHEELKATQSPETSGRKVYNIPNPANMNTINLGDNYSFLEDAGQVTQNIVDQNQSQSPLVLSMTKLGEIDNGVRQPLAGAKFILQAQNADGTWQQFNPEKATKDVAEVFTTGTDGKIVIKETDNQKNADADLIDLVLQYGGTDDYQAFRFREVKAALNPDPTGDAYLEPPAIDAANPTNYAASEPENSAALFTTKSVKLSGVSTTPSNPTPENPDDGDFGTVYNSNQPWLPYYKPGLGIGGGGWLDSMTSYIPKENAFAPQYVEGKTKYEFLTSGWKLRDYSAVGQGLRGVASNPGEEEKIKFTDVGFYKGMSVSLILTIRVVEKNTVISIGLMGDEFLDFGFDNLSAGPHEYEATLQFIDIQGNPVEMMEGNASFIYLDNKKTIRFPENMLKNIYSVSRSYMVNGKLTPILLKYGGSSLEDWLTVRSDVDRTGIDDQQQKFTLTYGTNQNGEFKLRLSTTRSGIVGTRFKTDSDAKVEIPDPQATTTVYPEIISENQGIVGTDNNQSVKSLSYSFIQQMPWESADPKNNRTQVPSWEMTAPDENQTLVADKWNVIPQDDPTQNTTTWFNYTGVGPDGNGTIAVKSSELSKDSFYNHYYAFERGLNIDYKEPIGKSNLAEKDNGYYFDFKGKVALDVDDTNPTPEQTAGMYKDPEPAEYNTSINFKADIDYKYVDAAGNELDADNLVKSGEGIVTWQVPLTPLSYADYGADGSLPENGKKAPTIPGYEFVRAELNGVAINKEDSTTSQLKVTILTKDGKESDKAEDYTENNVVTLVYQPVDYNVNVSIVSTKDNPQANILQEDAKDSFKIREVLDNTPPVWTGLAGKDSFTAGITYQLYQDISGTFEDSFKYDYSGAEGKVGEDDTATYGNNSPTFTVNVGSDGKWKLTADDNDYYIFTTSFEAETKTLQIYVVNIKEGQLTLQVDDLLDYGTVTVPQPKPNTPINNENNWSLSVMDTRITSWQEEEPWKLEVEMTEDFTLQNPPEYSKNKALPGIMYYAGEEGEPISLTKGSLFYLAEDEKGTKTFKWDKDKGFILKIDTMQQSKVYKDSVYEATLQFTLTPTDGDALAPPAGK